MYNLMYGCNFDDEFAVDCTTDFDDEDVEDTYNSLTLTSLSTSRFSSKNLIIHVIAIPTVTCPTISNVVQ